MKENDETRIYCGRCGLEQSSCKCSSSCACQTQITEKMYVNTDKLSSRLQNLNGKEIDLDNAIDIGLYLCSAYDEAQKEIKSLKLGIRIANKDREESQKTLDWCEDKIKKKNSRISTLEALLREVLLLIEPCGLTDKIQRVLDGKDCDFLTRIQKELGEG